MKILIAEDEAITRRVLERKLKSWGYEVISTVDGNEAWQQLQQKDSPGLILLDWMMPGMDGIEICKKLEALKLQTPKYVILLTARKDENDIVAGLEAGADDYITKPFIDSELHSRINVGRRMLKLQANLLEKEKFQGVLEMAGAVCHEMNQPLQVISGVTELLLIDSKDNDPLFDKIKTLKEHAERMGEITSKLMRITKYASKEYLRGKIIDIDTASDKTE